ncbi:hypothetical protein DBR06_SOUSAS41210003, partial [Sousa chinensis]
HLPSLLRAESCVTFRQAESTESRMSHQSVLLFPRYPCIL